MNKKFIEWYRECGMIFLFFGVMLYAITHIIWYVYVTITGDDATGIFAFTLFCLLGYIGIMIGAVSVIIPEGVSKND